MASSAVKARIQAFETMQLSNATVVSRSPPDLLETPISPTATSISPILPSTPSTPLRSMSPSPSPSPPILGRKTSLIDLKDWIVDDGPLPYVPRQKPPVARRLPSVGPKPTPRHVSDSMLSKIPPPLISLNSPPKTRGAPPLPPRKPSYTSLKSVSPSNSSSSSLARNGTQHPPIPIPTRSSSDSLTVDHTYPPLAKLGINIPSRHVPASSISSFHSVSLSSDGGTDPATPGTANSYSNHVATFPIDRDDFDPDRGSLREPDAVSLDESFENLSVTSAVSPSISSVSHDWEVYPQKRAPEPPKLPQRPSKPPASAPTSPRHSPLLVPKRDAPPPPPPSRPRPPSSRNSLASTSAASTSDRSSIVSTATSRTSVSTRSTTTPKPKSAQLARPTPVPPAARRRYEAVFKGNVIASRQAERAKSPPPNRKPRQAAGWRGLSVDLITNPEFTSNAGSAALAESVDEEIGPEDRLDGETVRAIWKLSRLERATLRVIWVECDPAGTGFLDRDGFVKGMWRIDEELRKAQMQRHLMPRIHLRQPKPTHAPRPILR
ncbi:hypothetical protein C8Q74DRAFT_1229370 [Fomes fomentarius]|nr:hypothetical protein C8Q74DRAFT_1229370 [Fomes fomentarius]